MAKVMRKMSRAKKRAAEKLRKTEFRQGRKLMVGPDDPALSTVCTPITPADDARGIAEKMRLACGSFSNGVGLAAPQIGITKRMIMVWPDRKPSPHSSLSITVKPPGDEDGRRKPIFMVNPVVMSAEGGQVVSREGCLSYALGTFVVDVPRFPTVTVQWHDLNGEPRMHTFNNFAAFVVQHEMDHLDGVCRVGDEWRRYRKPRMSTSTAAMLIGAVASHATSYRR